MFSEKPKAKRGRPRKYDNPTDRANLENRSAQILGALFQKKAKNKGELTVRQQQNYIRAERAQIILSKSVNAGAFFHYFLDRNTLLAELGRIEDESHLASVAYAIVSRRLRGAAALAEIRKFRHGGRWPDITRLLNKVRKAVREYRN